MTDLEKAMLEFDEIINRPSHYNTGEIEVWDFIINRVGEDSPEHSQINA